MQIGVVGKPSVGKSTLFKSLTLAEVDIANYPFTTIKPNTGVGHVKVKDPALDFDKRSNPRNGYVKGDFRFVPVQLVDVAGLVPGASEGQGMGNEFLNDLSQADVLIHVIDISGSVNEKGEPVDALSYDPAKDVEFLETELDLWYLGLIKKGWEKFARQVNQEKSQVNKAVAKHLTGLGVTEALVEDAVKELHLPESILDWNEGVINSLAILLRKKTKPMIIACNKIDVPGAEENYNRLQAQFPQYKMIGCSAESELALKEAEKHDIINYIPGEADFSITQEDKLNDKQKQALEFIKNNIIEKFDSTGVQNVLDQAVFKVLEYIPIFPGGASKLEDKDGNVLPDCFLLPNGSTALDFAYKLHTDFGKNFIRAIDVKTKRTVGKEHELQFGDIVEIVAGK